MQYEFRGQNLQDAISKALSKYESKSERQTQTCNRIQEEIYEWQRETLEALSDLETLSEDLKARIERLGYDDTWAKINIGVDLLLIVTGVGGIISAVRGAKRALSAGRSLTQIWYGANDLLEVIDAIGSAAAGLDKIREGNDISDARSIYRRAQTTLHYAIHRMKELRFAYENHQCAAVFGRDF